jgi:hypothetical protein
MATHEDEAATKQKQIIAILLLSMNFMLHHLQQPENLVYTA